MNRKYVLGGTLALLSLTVFSAVELQAGPKPADQALFEKNIGNFVKAKPERLVDPALDHVFNAVMYRVTISLKDDVTGAFDSIVGRQGDRVVVVTLAPTSADMPQLVKLIRPEFVLKSDADGQALQDALKLLYPPDKGANLSIKHQAKKWTFVWGTRADDSFGFVITATDSGKVTGIKYLNTMK